jgi:hypothetical protein
LQKKAALFNKGWNVQGIGWASEEKAWGIILADTARHIAGALESGYAENYSEVIRKIREIFENE